MTVALAATIHDVEARLVPAIARNAPVLRTAFDGIAINMTDTTAPDVVDAVRLALGFAAAAILYCYFDHVLRWIGAGAGELAAVRDSQPDIDMLVVGRSAPAFAAEPARLRETEGIVNHIYALMSGRPWDLMFAVRRLSRRCAETVVRDGRIDTIANDVEWPLLAERAGLSLGYAEADGLYYRTMDEFGAAADTHDTEPGEWIRRIEIATLHAGVMKSYLRQGPD